ncbi:MAG: DUF3786 domain-containing protein [Methanomassiliicoccales archaeon]
MEESWSRLMERQLSGVAEFSRSSMDNDTLRVRFFDHDLLVDPGRRCVERDGEDAGPFVSVLILHYLLGCGPADPTGRYITFREVPGGDIYYPTFRKRAIDRLARVFEERPRDLIRAGESIGASPADIGTASVEVRVFPKVPVTVVMWEGDEEIPASANILFDETLPDILPMEDVSILGNMVSSKLRKVGGSLPQVDSRG